MKKESEWPDFIVDPDGNVKDVRGYKQQVKSTSVREQKQRRDLKESIFL